MTPNIKQTLLTDPLGAAIQLLTKEAAALRECHTPSCDRDDWTGESESKAAHDNMLRVADALSKLRAPVTGEAHDSDSRYAIKSDKEGAHGSAETGQTGDHLGSDKSPETRTDTGFSGGLLGANTVVLPPLPANVTNVARRIRRCTEEAVAEVVLAHLANSHARAAVLADRQQRARDAETWPEEPTPTMIEALRTGSRKDWPSDELCRVRYAALRAALAVPDEQEERHD